MKRLPLLKSLTCLFLLGGVSVINAAVFSYFDADVTGYDNSGSNDHDELYFDLGGGTSQTHLAYQVTSDSFGGDIAAGTTLQLKAAIFDGTAAGTPTVTVTLHSNNAGEPGAAIATWTINSFDAVGTAKASLTTHNSDATTTTTISQNSTYWLSWTVSGTDLDAARFHYSTDAGNTTWADQDTDNPGTWNVNPIAGPVGAFEISAVPEPGEYALMAGILLIGFVIFRQRRARRA